MLKKLKSESRTFIINHFSSPKSIGCKTKAVKEAPKQNENCVFPFVYNGQSYSNCTNIDFGVVFWCSTEANATDSNWGVCEDSCPKEKIGKDFQLIFDC